jgi:purine-cytosine permease-like protein
MHAQNFGPWALRVPRIAFVTFGFLAAITVGCCAAAFFEDTLETFLSIIGYWTIIHLVVIIEEHIIFRRSRWQNYDWDAWASWDLLPFGWGAIAAFVFGFVGAALGMKVSWYTAPIAGLIGKKGGNIGHELTALFCGVAFPVFRWMEKRWTGK